MNYSQNFENPDLDFQSRPSGQRHREQFSGHRTAPQPPKHNASVHNKWTINRWKVLGVVALLALFLVVYVTQVISTNALLLDIEKLETEQRHRQTKNENLIREINSLESPERITTIAKSKFNLTTPRSVPQFVNQ